MVKKTNGLPFDTTDSTDDSMPLTNSLKQEKHPAQSIRLRSYKYETETSWLGRLADCTEIHGDIISPVMDESQWETLAG